MNTEQFLAAYQQSRNGCDHFIRHPLVRSFAYSDGVQSCAEAGCYWLLDIASSELPKVMRSSKESLVTLVVSVSDSKASMTLTGSGDAPLHWSKRIPYTDLPGGEWVFLVADEQQGDTPFRMILPSEY